MTLRRIKLLTVVMVLCVLFLTPGVAQPTSSQFTYYWVGCWKPTPDAICRDVFGRSGSTSMYLCRPCNTTTNIGPGYCIGYPSSYLFNNGTWCD